MKFMSQENVIWDAEFNDSVTSYWLLNGAIVCVVTIFGIALLPIWYLFGKWFTRRYLESHVCTLTNRTLKVKKGVWIKIEKTVPLDRITDMGIVQGPIMRYLDIEALSVETAGQSTMNSLVKLEGIKNGREFRDAVLAQRDLVVGSSEENLPSAAASSLQPDSTVVDLLTEIRDSLQEIKSKGGI